MRMRNRHPGNQTSSPWKALGFTLVELIIVIVLLGIIGAAIGPLIGNKFFAVAQSSERAQWVQQAEYALFHLRQDLAHSVPNSVFTGEPVSGADQVVEMLGRDSRNRLFAARYRVKQYTPYDRLQLTGDTSFDIFTNQISSAAYVSVNTTDATQMRLDWQTLQSGTNTGTIARVSTVAEIAGGVENGSPAASVTLSASHNFAGHSPYNRAYFSDGPVGYQCDTSAGILYRVSGYSNLDSSAFSSRTNVAIRNRIVDNLTDCQFRLVAGTTYSPPALAIRLQIGNGTENITLTDVIQLSNGS